MTDQHERDLAAVREHGFSHLPQATRDRLMHYTDSNLRENSMYKVNDLVGLDPVLARKYRGQTFKVVKINPKSYKLQPLNGGIPVNASKELVTDAPVTSTAAGTAQSVPLADPVAHLVCGTLVRVHNGKHDRDWLKDGDLGVVLLDKGERVNVAPLGGFEDRYGRLPRRMLTVVNPADVINVKPF